MYYYLIERESVSAKFFDVFGDYDKGAVEFEKQDRRDSGALAKNLRIISFKRAPSHKALLARLDQESIKV